MTLQRKIWPTWPIVMAHPCLLTAWEVQQDGIINSGSTDDWIDTRWKCALTCTVDADTDVVMIL